MGNKFAAASRRRQQLDAVLRPELERLQARCRALHMQRKDTPAGSAAADEVLAEIHELGDQIKKIDAQITKMISENTLKSTKNVNYRRKLGGKSSRAGHYESVKFISATSVRTVRG